MPYLHEAYRAASVGLQAGLGAAALLWALRLVGLCTCTCACPCGAFVLASALGALVALRVSARRIPHVGRGVLITGCDSGFGLALALRLQAIGCTVFAGCLQADGDNRSDGAKQLAQLPRVHVLQLDVTSDQQIEAARSYVQQHQPLKGLWGVVNNAGLFDFGPAEIVRPEDISRLFNVNTLGALRVSKAFLPLLRRTKGRLVNLTSVAGRAYCGPMAPYMLTKHAAAALADSLRLEQRRFGVHVAVVEPGDFAAATRILQADALKASFGAAWRSLSDQARADYGEGFGDAMLNGFLASLRAPSAHSLDVRPVLAALEHALLGCWPAPRYTPADLRYTLRVWLYTHAPEWLFEALYA